MPEERGASIVGQDEAQYVGLDVAQKTTALCVVSHDGSVWQGECRTTPQAIAAAIVARAPRAARVGMETGPLAVWLWYELRALGGPIQCLHARHAKAALAIQLNKTDANAAYGLAQIVRTGWYRPVELKSMASYHLRLVLGTRARLVSTRTSIYNQVRGVLKTFGVVLPPGKGTAFVSHVQQLTPNQPMVQLVVGAHLAHWTAVTEQVREYDRLLRQAAAHDPVCRRLMSAPGVGALTAIAFRTAIDDPARFRSVADVGAYLGLTPRRNQSGQVDRAGRITKSGDALVRTLLFEAAHQVLTRSRAPSALRHWGLRVARRAGHRKAVVAVARKLAGILLTLWRYDTSFLPDPSARAA